LSAIQGTAVILESDRSGAAFGQFSDFEILNRFGTRKYRLRLEVRLPDRDPYEVEAELKVPRKAENTGFLPGSREIGKPLPPGLELPVSVNPSDLAAVEVDWDRFVASPGRKDAQRAASQTAYNQAVAEQASKNPKLVEQMRAGNRSAVQAWAGAVKAGNMSREQFEESVTLEVETGRMDPADAEAARKTLDG
jgi:hypothetical protein